MSKEMLEEEFLAEEPPRKNQTQEMLSANLKVVQDKIESNRKKLKEAVSPEEKSRIRQENEILDQESNKILEKINYIAGQN